MKQAIVDKYSAIITPGADIKAETFISLINDLLDELVTGLEIVKITPGVALESGEMGIDAPFGTSVLRIINRNTNGGAQVVTSGTGSFDIYRGDKQLLKVEENFTTFGGAIIIGNPSIPTSSSSSGSTGMVAYDSNYIYICVGQNDWRRTPLLETF